MYVRGTIKSKHLVNSIITKEVLQDMYVKNKMSIEKIAKKMDIGSNSVRTRLIRHGIKIRTIAEAKRKLDYSIVNESELRRLYYTENLSMEKIGLMFNVSPLTIGRLFSIYNIPRRTISEAHGGRPLNTTCINCGGNFHAYPSSKYRRFCSRNCWVEFSTGENHPSWSGGKEHKRYRRTIVECKKMDREFNLTIEQYISLREQDCYYCGNSGGGIDRKINSIGYVIENCIPSCWECNKLKGTMDIDEFLCKIKQIYYYLSLEDGKCIIKTAS